ncbi:hypothetical protein N9390_11420 [Gammaproteobacteria bacterium]|nr:hypothetical protein [Gammaproteobacteria bacterium]
MKKLILLVALFVSPVFAQEEEQEVQIEIESGGGVQVASAASDTNVRTIAAFPDKSVWYFVTGIRDDGATYCYIDDEGNPRCKVVELEE